VLDRPSPPESKPFWHPARRLRYPFAMQRKLVEGRRPSPARAGQTLDVVLMVTALLPLAAMALPQTRRIIGLVFELSCDLIAMPFL